MHAVLPKKGLLLDLFDSLDICMYLHTYINMYLDKTRYNIMNSLIEYVSI